MRTVFHAPILRLTLGMMSGPTPRLFEASGFHVPVWAWLLASAVGICVTLWAISDVARRLGQQFSDLTRDPHPSAEPSFGSYRERRGEAMAYLVRMNSDHGHMDLEGVRRALRKGTSFKDGDCWVCGRPRSSWSGPMRAGLELAAIASR